MTPTDDVALPELSDAEYLRAFLTPGLEHIVEIHARNNRIRAIADRLESADRARASERSTAKDGRDGEFASHCRRIGTTAYDMDLYSTAVRAAWNEAWRTRSSPLASDAALERAAARYSRTTIDAAKQIVREEFDRQPMLWKQPTPCRILDRLDALMQPTATDETGERG